MLRMLRNFNSELLNIKCFWGIACSSYSHLFYLQEPLVKKNILKPLNLRWHFASSTTTPSRRAKARNLSFKNVLSVVNWPLVSLQETFSFFFFCRDVVLLCCFSLSWLPGLNLAAICERQRVEVC